MNEYSLPEGLIHAVLLDGKGGGRVPSAAEIANWTPAQGRLWLHFDVNNPRTRDWFRDHSNVPRLIGEALLASETRPRAQPMGDGFLVVLRGVNLNPDSDPEDMVAIRVWADDQRIITTRKRNLLSVEHIRAELMAGNGPRDSGAFLVILADQLITRMGSTLDGFDDRLSDIEERIIAGAPVDGMRLSMADMRRELITLRRYLSPQREAISRLAAEKSAWLSDQHQHRLREVNDRLTRYIEDMDAVRDRAVVVQEELLSHLSEQLNQRMYTLSIISAIFLPLGFLTGLLGINVGGIPGTENGQAFWWVVGSLLVFVAVQLIVFRRFRWL